MDNAMTTPTVSIIVPVYNTSTERLSSCVESILVQKDIGIEIILVDDGSDQEVLNCLELLSRKFDMVKLVYSSHKGVSSARNLGTHVACGTYVMYVDSDDEVTPGSIAQGVEVMKATSADVAFGFLQRIHSEEDKHSSVVHMLDQTYEEIPVEDLLEYHFKGYVKDARLYSTDKSLYVKIGPVARLIRRDLALSTPFPEDVTVSEDTVWNIDLLMKCKKTVVVQSCWYWYWSLPDSTIRNYRPNVTDETICCLEALRAVLGTRGMDRYLIGYLARSTGEINRIARYYAMPECPKTLTEKRLDVSRAYECSVKQYLDIKRTIASRDMLLIIKLLLCRTGLNVVVFGICARFR